MDPIFAVCIIMFIPFIVMIIEFLVRYISHYITKPKPSLETIKISELKLQKLENELRELERYITQQIKDNYNSNVEKKEQLSAF